MKDADFQALREVFEARPYVQFALLFGSAARNDLTPASDLDLAVLGRAPLDAEQTMDLVAAIGSRCGRPVDLVDLRVNHGIVAHEALVTGKIVFCRDRLAYAERLRQMLYDEADFLPILRRADQQSIRKWLKTSFSPKSAP